MLWGRVCKVFRLKYGSKRGARAECYQYCVYASLLVDNHAARSRPAQTSSFRTFCKTP